MTQIKFVNKAKPLPKTFRHRYAESFLKFDDGLEEKFLHSAVNELLNNKKTDFYGWECDIGLESLFVQYNGKVQRGNCAEGGFIGNINTGVEWPSVPIVCSKNVCHCSTDIVISKRAK